MPLSLRLLAAVSVAAIATSAGARAATPAATPAPLTASSAEPSSPSSPAAGAPATPMPAGATPPTADAIFAAMRASLLARAYPREIKYAVAIEGWDGKAWHGRTYDSFAFPSKNEIRAKTVSREENANPTRPNEFGISIAGFEATKGVDARPDPIGVPRLSPAYAFGLVPAPHAGPVIPAPVPSGALPTIGESSAIAKIYDVSLAGAETVHGYLCWHLKLEPVGNPGKYRVCDVWVTQSGAQLVRLRTDGNFTGKPTGSGSWTANYARSEGGSWYLTTEISYGEVEADDDITYKQMRVRFLDVAPDAREIYDTTLPSSSVTYLEEPTI